MDPLVNQIAADLTNDGPTSADITPEQIAGDLTARAPAQDISPDAIARDLLTPTSIGSGTPVENVTEPTTFGRALRRGGATTSTLVGEFQQFFGDVLDIEGLQQAGETRILEAAVESINNPAEVESSDDVDSLAKAGTFVMEKIGEQLPFLASIAIGGVAGAATRIGARGLSAAVGKAFLKKAGRKGVKMNLKRSAAGGAFAAGEVFGIGEVAGELGDEAADNPFLTIGAGTAIAGLDLASLGAIYKVAFPEVRPAVAHAFVKRVARGFGVGITAEAPTEALQELIAVASNKFNDPSYEIYTPENLKRIREAGIVGGIVGGALGGAGGTAGAVTSNLKLAAGDKVVRDGKRAADTLFKSDPTTQAEGLFDTDLIVARVKERWQGVKDRFGKADETVKRGLDENTQQAAKNTAAAEATAARDEVDQEILKQEQAAEAELLQSQRVTDMLGVFDQRIDDAPDTEVTDGAADKQIISLLQRARDKRRNGETDVTEEFGEALEILESQSRKAMAGDKAAAKKRLRQLSKLVKKMRSDLIARNRAQRTKAKAELGEIRSNLTELGQRYATKPTKGPVPEGMGTLQRQAVAVARGAKSAVLATTSEQIRFLQERSGKVLRLIPTEYGLVGVKRDDRRTTVEVREAANQGRLHEVLGFAKPLEQIDADSAAVLTQRDETGAVVEDQVVDDTAIAQAMQESGVSPENFELRTPQEVTEERTDELLDEERNRRSRFIYLANNNTQQVTESPDGILPTQRKGYGTLAAAQRAVDKLQESFPTREYELVENEAGGWIIREEFESTEQLREAMMIHEIERTASKVKSRLRLPNGKNINLRKVAQLGRLVNAGIGNNRGASQVLNLKADFLTGLAVLSEHYGIPIDPTEIPSDRIIMGDEKGGITYGHLTGTSERIAHLMNIYDRSGPTWKGYQNRQRVEAELRDMGVFEDYAGEIVVFEETPDGRVRKELLPRDRMDRGPDEMGQPSQEEQADANRLDEYDRYDFFAETGPRTAEAQDITDQVANLTNLKAAAPFVTKLLRSIGIKQRIVIVDETSAGKVFARIQHNLAIADGLFKVLARQEEAFDSPELRPLLEDVSEFTGVSVERLLEIDPLVVVSRQKEAWAHLQTMMQESLRPRRGLGGFTNTFIPLVLRDLPADKAFLPVFIRAKDQNVPFGMNRIQALAHEIGHVVEAVALYGAPAPVREALVRSFGGHGISDTSKMETFAQNFMRWAGEAAAEGRIVPLRSGPLAGRKHNIKNLTEVEQFIHDLAVKLYEVWKAFVRTWNKSKEDPYTEEFQDFMNALWNYHAPASSRVPIKTQIGREWSEWIDVFGSVPYFTVSEGIYDWKTEDQSEYEYLVNGIKNETRFVVDPGVYEEYAEGREHDAPRTPQELASDEELNSYVKRAIAFGNRFKRRPWEAVKSLVVPADVELRSMGLDWLANHFWSRPGQTDVGATVFEMISAESSPLHNKLDTLMRMHGFQRFKTVLATEKPTAQTLRTRNALVRGTPLEEIKDAATRKQVAAVRSYFEEVAKRYEHISGKKLNRVKNFFPMQLDALAVEKDSEAVIDILVEQGWDVEEAQKFVWRVTHESSGGLIEALEEQADEDIAGPGDPFLKHRKLSDADRQALEKYWHQDVAQVAMNYTDFMIRRAVWENHFSLDAMGVTLDQAEEVGVKPNDPIAGLQYKLKDEVRRGRLTFGQYDRVTNAVLPGYAGRLGMDMNQKLRRIMGHMTLYQNVRLLPLSIFSQFVDMGTMFNRADWDGVKSIGQVWKEATSEDGKEMARILGVLRDGLTDHILNDQVLNTYMTGRAARLNDTFFRWNLMEGWTNKIRTLATLLGRDYIQKHAKLALEGNEESSTKLRELGITDPNEVAGWDGHAQTASDAIKYALHRYVDQSMLRPTPATRPVHMSDPHYMLWAHLKPFLYTFHEVFTRRVMHTVMKDKSVLPLITFAMFVLPFAMVGYELRRLITGATSARPDGFGYLWEMTQRTGALGPFQMVADMESADSFGKPFLVGAAGPSLEQTYEFMSRDLDYTISRALPLANQFPAAREFVRNE